MIGIARVILLLTLLFTPLSSHPQGNETKQGRDANTSQPSRIVVIDAQVLNRKTYSFVDGLKVSTQKPYASLRLNKRITSIAAHQMSPEVAIIAQLKSSASDENRPAIPPASHAPKKVIPATRLAHLT
jgi:hypothetical protein